MSEHFLLLAGVSIGAVMSGMGWLWHWRSMLYQVHSLRESVDYWRHNANQANRQLDDRNDVAAGLRHKLRATETAVAERANWLPPQPRSHGKFVKASGTYDPL